MRFDRSEQFSLTSLVRLVGTHLVDTVDTVAHGPVEV